jgi:ribosome-associated toxin RatA of RatAB toxin-antitoxin module
MHSTIGIRVSAPAERLFRLASDLARWPALLPHYRSVDIEARSGGRVLARMVAVRRFGPLPVPVTWRAEHWADDADPTDLRLRFRHVRGVTRGMDVTWHVRPIGTGCDVTIEHDFRRRVPLVGEGLVPHLVDRFFTRHIASRTLATFKQLAESADGARANHPT